MTEDQKKINELLTKLENLLLRQDSFQKEIAALRAEINQLRLKVDLASGASQQLAEDITTQTISPDKPVVREFHQEMIETPTAGIARETQARPPQKPSPKPKKESNLEKFIGENLISKIGIVITIIGVGIGVNYAIDHQLLSPIMRVSMGYALGLGLLVFALILKKKYLNFSAVLISGAVSIGYFITYASYSFYALIPRMPAFVAMVLLTIAAVYIAINYNKQVIAHIGLVGAYAVPFLLSDGSGNYAILFTYMTIINAGILALAFRKYWKSLYNVAFILTWLIYTTWYFIKFEINLHTPMALGFLLVFFLTFYVTFLAHKLIKKEDFSIGDIILLLANSFIFYGLGYSILDNHPQGGALLGLFTVANAIFHLIASTITYRQKADEKLFYLLLGLALVFITIAIPVQLDGNWVTMLWVGEAALLFWIGRTQNTVFYERLAYLMMFIAFASLLHDWDYGHRYYNPESPERQIAPFLNIYFLTSMLFAGAFAFINYVNFNDKFSKPLIEKDVFRPGMNYLIPAIFTVSLYYGIFAEIDAYWDIRYADSIVSMNPNEERPFSNGFVGNFDLKGFKTIWLINYTLVFLSVLSLVNTVKLKIVGLANLNLAMNAIAILLLITAGFDALGDLRISYMQPGSGKAMNLGIRYISFALGGLLVYSCYDYLKKGLLKGTYKMGFDLLLHVFILACASNELITWMELAGSGQSHKLGLSILWGIHSLLLIVMGIIKKKQHLRIGAIILFGGTLLKLFFYDLTHLNTIAKTIVFVSLGILLLIISFLYNKFKGIIFEEEKEKILQENQEHS